MMENKNCEECGQVFQYTPNPSFPRKYCPACSASKKASYLAKQSGVPVDTTQPHTPSTPRADFAPAPKFMSEKDKSIVAQVCIKEAARLASSTDITKMTPEEVGSVIILYAAEMKKAYDFTLKLFDEN